MSKNAYYTKAHRSVVKHVKAQMATLRRHKKAAKSKEKRTGLQRAIDGLSVVHDRVVGGCEEPPLPKKRKA